MDVHRSYKEVLLIARSNEERSLLSMLDSSIQGGAKYVRYYGWDTLAFRLNDPTEWNSDYLTKPTHTQHLFQNEPTPIEPRNTNCLDCVESLKPHKAP